MISGNYAEGCPKIAESLALDATPGAARDLRLCDELRTGAERQARTQRAVGLTLGGIGVAALVASGIMGILAESARSSASEQCSASSGVCGPSAQSDLERFGTLRTASVGSAISGAVATGAGAIIFFTAPKAVGSAVGLAPSPQGTGVSLAARF
jgi:hypothetical protein